MSFIRARITPPDALPEAAGADSLIGKNKIKGTHAAMFSTAHPTTPPGAEAELPARIVRVARTDSVLLDARRLIAEGALPLFGSVFADEQTAGRGQYGRAWQSARGNVHAAIRLPLEGVWATSARAAALSTLIVRTLRLAGYAAELKWPNDIVCETPSGPVKTGGILLEERDGALTAGIGLNVSFAPEADALRSGAALPAGRLVPAGGTPADAFALWEQIARDVAAADPVALERRWRVEALARLIWFGRDVRVEDAGGDVLFGRLTGLARTGELILETAPGRAVLVDRGSLSPAVTPRNHRAHHRNPTFTAR